MYNRGMHLLIPVLKRRCGDVASCNGAEGRRGWSNLSRKRQAGMCVTAVVMLLGGIVCSFGRLRNIVV